MLTSGVQRSVSVLHCRLLQGIEYRIYNYTVVLYSRTLFSSLTRFLRVTFNSDDQSHQ